MGGLAEAPSGATGLLGPSADTGSAGLHLVAVSASWATCQRIAGGPGFSMVPEQISS